LIQDVARPRNPKGVIDRRWRSGVREKHVRNGRKQVVTTMHIGEMQQQQKRNGCIWGCSLQRPWLGRRIRAVDGRTLQQRCQIKIWTMTNCRTERLPGRARLVLRTPRIYDNNTRITAFLLRLSPVWCCGCSLGVCRGAKTTRWGSRNNKFTRYDETRKLQIATINHRNERASDAGPADVPSFAASNRHKSQPDRGDVKRRCSCVL
jgi:hypothetical protein